MRRTAARDLAADIEGHPVLPARELFRIYVPFLRAQWPGYVLAGVLTVLGTAVALLTPWPLKYLFDEVLVPVGGQTRTDVQGVLLLIVVALAVVTIADSLVNLIRSYVLAVVGERVSASIRSSLYAHLQKLPLAYHESTPTGELTTRLTGDVDKVRGFLTDKIVKVSSSVLTLVGMAGVLLVLDWQLSVGMLLVMPMLAFTVARFRARIKAVENASRDVEGDLAASAQESLTAIKLVKSMGRESHDAERYAEMSTASMHSILHVTRTTARLTWALDFLVAVATAALVWLGAQRVISGALTPGDLVIFTAYLRDFFGPTRALARFPAQYTKTAVRGTRIADVLRLEPTILDRPGAVPAEEPARALRLDKLDFEYVPGHPVLKEIDVAIPVGRTLAIVGPTGAGKSTIAALLCRLQDPTGGRVLMDGVDLRDLTMESVHQQIGLVLQDAILFRSSVAENIAYARPDASRAEIEEAARVAQAHDFVTELPEGYDTVLAERAATLSGGQRQRLALARAVLSGSPVLVLDEPTTGLDARSESAVLSALMRVSEGRTTVVITHRMAAAMTADEIVVLDEGVVVARGTHEGLLASHGLYAEMCRLQGIGPSGSNGASSRRPSLSEVLDADVDGITRPAPEASLDLLRTSAQRVAGRVPTQKYDESSLLAALESRYDFGRWLSVQRSDDGYSNDSWFVETEAGDIVVRRSSSLKTVPAARFECALIDHLVAEDYPAPWVLRTRDGDAWVEVDGRVHLATRKLPGTMYAKGDSTHLAVAARGLGRYHRIVADLPTDLMARESSALRSLHPVGPQRLGDAVGVMAPMLSDTVRVRAEADAAALILEMELVWQELDPVLEDLTYLIVHGSFGPSALLLVESEMTGVVDFDRARHDVLGVDLAYAIEHFCRPSDRKAKNRIDMATYERFLEHYRPESPATDIDIEALPLVLRAQRLIKVAKRAGSVLTKHALEPRQPDDAAGFAEMLGKEVLRLRWLEANLSDLPGSQRAGV